MQFLIEPNASLPSQAECLVVGLFDNGEFCPVATQLDQLSKGYLSQLVQQGDLSGKLGQGQLLFNLPNSKISRLLVLGCGKKEAFGLSQAKQAAEKMIACLKETKIQHAHCSLTALASPELTAYRLSRSVVESVLASLYHYDAFKSEKSSPAALHTLTLIQADEAAVKVAQAVGLGVKVAKDVANCPPNVCNPRYLADLALSLADQYATIQTDIIDENEMAQLGMNAYLAVSRGSANAAFMSIIRYTNHPDPNAQPIVLVGKGLTFDSGGISIKPAEAMDEMKYDMGGAASVYGTMKALAELNLPLNVIGVLAGCENMVGGNAYRPGDILTTMSGKTVEVLNTDAEGRLVLCDALTYVARFKPACVVDIATLTGACMIALGAHHSGLISTHDEIAEALLNAGKATGDKAWRLPMGEEYQEQLKSPFADLANIGGRLGGAITAGVFLSNFADYPWAHLDIAGTAWKSGAAKGATGRPVPLLTEFLLNQTA